MSCDVERSFSAAGMCGAGVVFFLFSASMLPDIHAADLHASRYLKALEMALRSFVSR